jgi:hypothetical protein
MIPCYGLVYLSLIKFEVSILIPEQVSGISKILKFKIS